MKTLADLRPVQDRAITFGYERDRSIIHARPGGGKTVVAGTIINDWISDGVCRFPLVTAPLRVSELVWPTEISGWEHLKHLKVHVLTGSRAERDAITKTIQPGELTIVNHENLLDMLAAHPKFWDALVIDELSKFKGTTSRRWQPLLKLIDHIPLRMGLTGSPMPNSLEDLFGQARIIDSSLLGRSFGRWRNENMIMTSELPVPIWAPRTEAFLPTLEKLAPITFTLSPEHWKPPPIEYQKIDITLPPALRELYERLEEEEMLEVGSDVLVPGGKAQVQNKLQQLCSGFYYTYVGGEQRGRRLDTFRLDIVGDIVEMQHGDPICIVYDYVEQLDELRRRYPKAPVLGQGTTRKKAEAAYQGWNDGSVPILILHPASAGHGLNLQFGGHKLVRCSLPWSLDHFEQVPLRFAREGQKAAATKSWDLVARSTVEERVFETLSAKAARQESVFTWPGANT